MPDGGRRTSRYSVLGALGLICLGLPSDGHAQTTRYVDPQISTSSCTTYSTAARSCGAGSATAYRDLQGASQAAQPGDTVLVRQSTITTQFAPQQSGSEAGDITFRPFGSEAVTISNVSSPAIYLLNRSYVIIEGFVVTNVLGWGRIEGSSHNVIRNNEFSNATANGTTGGMKLVSSSHNTFEGNSFTGGNDNMLLQDSDHNLIAGNTFIDARHTLLNISCGNFNVVRGNTFNNVDQKGIENYDCEGTVSGQPVKLDATKHNVWEDNTFSGTRASSSNHNYNAMQYSGQEGIVRRNVYYDNLGGAVNLQVYSDEALYNYGHRVYHNTFYNNRCNAIAASGNSAPSRYYDNVVKNNLLYKNFDCGGGGTQTAVGNTTAVVMTNNAILTSSPLFVNETARDLRLQNGSPQIDAAAFLTTAVGAGSGTVLGVADAAYFYDGFGIAGETGDTIQLAGQTQWAIIVSVNYANNTLVLDRSLSWSNGQGVALAYSGAGPDLGAYETGTEVETPAAPVNLRVAP